MESIQAHRVRYGKNEYLVKWKGYAVHEMTWEPEENCKNAQSAIKKFRERRDALTLTLTLTLLSRGALNP